MHILVIPSWYRSAEEPISGIFFRQQAQALRRAGFQVGVIYPHFRSLRLLRSPRADLRPRVHWEMDDGVATYRYEGWSLLPGFPKVFHRNWVRMGKLLFKQYVEQFGRPDLIHAHSIIHGGVLAMQLQATYGIPYVLTEHSSAYALGWYRPWHLPLAEICLRQAQARLVVSPILGRRLEELFGAAACPWQWVPNIVDPAFAAAPLTPLASTQSAERPFRFLCVAHLEANKRQVDLIQAFARCFRQNSQVQLRLVGDGPCRPQLEELVTHSGLLGQVTLAGRLDQPQVLTEIQAADALVLTSQYETFGVVLIEALACGKPVIATACGGPEYIVHAGNGLLVPVQDVDALSAALTQMVTSAAHYNPATLREDCLQHFSEQAVISQLTTVYHAAQREQ